MLLKCQNSGAKRFIASASIILCLCCIYAQAQYRFDHWTTDDGLPQNSVNALVQTRDGYLWIGTFGGLARLDGVKFTVFNTVNAPALKSLRITALYEDRTGLGDREKLDG